jgi:hypothetical protein
MDINMRTRPMKAESSEFRSLWMIYDACPISIKGMQCMPKKKGQGKLRTSWDSKEEDGPTPFKYSY